MSTESGTQLCSVPPWKRKKKKKERKKEKEEKKKKDESDINSDDQRARALLSSVFKRRFKHRRYVINICIAPQIVYALIASAATCSSIVTSIKKKEAFCRASQLLYDPRSGAGANEMCKRKKLTL